MECAGLQTMQFKKKIKNRSFCGTFAGGNIIHGNIENIGNAAKYIFFEKGACADYARKRIIGDI